VKFHQVAADAGIGSEIGREGDARQLALKVGGVAGAVFGVVEQGVDVVEDVELGDGFLVIMRAELGATESSRFCTSLALFPTAARK